ncbi:FCD domain-containing protein [Saccharopolyspora sp. K220]|uniref:FadR/GntR family transcriptional regulator n=1 Tax=Saccharopolyspora soli TaxID=2926618 RepID=UPI001F589978|nr:FCD domain-containing protein [Saccharopolyspora soli]MCI2420618.1 FCD domain-containing protein [Saccharopolyspora soli]
MSEHRPRGVHGQTVEALASRILSNELSEGATLDLPALRAELDVSLTALREALKVLAAKGMIDARQKRGTFVRPRALWNKLDADVMRWQTSASDDSGLFDELTEVRAVVEPAAAKLAAQRATDADLDALDDALRWMSAAGSDIGEMVTADLNFHRLLLSATHNDLLVQIGRVIAIGLAERDKLVHDANPSDDPVPSHREVLDAVVARDPVAAEAAMQALVDKSSADLARAKRSPKPAGRGST